MVKNKFNLEPQFLIRVLKNEISPEEREVFDKWLTEKDENKEEFGQIALLWEKIGSLPTPLSPELNEEWKRFLSRITIEQSEEIHNGLFSHPFLFILNFNRSFGKTQEKLFSQSIKKKIVFIRIFSVIFISLLFYWFLGKPLEVSEVTVETKPIFYEFITKRGERAVIPLSDGSMVYLNADSKLMYPKFFEENKRYLKLEGEAYFSIKSEKNRPFIVQTGDKYTIVKGTEFNIKFRDNKLSVVVTKGRVALYNQDSSKFVDLVRGQLSYAKGNGFSKPIFVDTRLYTAWRENKLSFVETPFEEVLREIERFYNVDVICKNKKILSRTLTGYFDSISLDDILNKISLALDFKYIRKGNKIYIYN